MRWLIFGALALLAGCGFGLYNGSADPQVTSANDGVWDAGQWWPWACPNGANPAPASPTLNYTATGTCGGGGPFGLSVDGCELFGDWGILGLADVSTTLPSSIPQAGGWEVVGTGDFAVSDGGMSWSCAATAIDASGDLALTCTAGVPPVTACESSLTVASK